jgi:N-acetyl-gamma-glutamyl-phosphate reductase
VSLKRPVSHAEVEDCFRGFYVNSPFVRVFAPPRLPEVQHSQYTNFCDLGWVLAPDGTRLMLVSCIDNLLKGAAGQAVQNMNLMYGWDEREGLLATPAAPFSRPGYATAALPAGFAAGVAS